MWRWDRWGTVEYDGPALGQAQVVRRLSGSMARGAALVGVVTTVLCAVGGVIAAGIPGLSAAALGGLLATGSALLTPMLMLRTTHLEPGAVMLAAFGGLALKAIILLLALFTLGVGRGCTACHWPSRCSSSSSRPRRRRPGWGRSSRS